MRVKGISLNKDINNTMKQLVVYFSRVGENSVNGQTQVIKKGFTEILAEKISHVVFLVIVVKEGYIDHALGKTGNLIDLIDEMQHTVLKVEDIGDIGNVVFG